MSFDVFINFDGDCRAAIEFYAGVFKLELPTQIMTYGQNPGADSLSGGAADADKDRILYATLPIFGCNVMFSDCPSGSEYVKGTNIALTLGTSDAEELKGIYAALAYGGEIAMPLGKTFFSELYGMVTDKFGTTWQLSLTPFVQ
jgi:PhnB protein